MELLAPVQAILDSAREGVRSWFSSEDGCLAIGDLLAAEELAGVVGRSLSLTPFGVVNLRDAYTYCRECQSSERPLHKLLGTGVETWSLLVQEDIIDLASDESCAKSVAKLERHHPGVQMGRTTACATALRFLHEHGKRARGFIENKHALARASQEKAPKDRGPIAQELEVEYDGGMIPVATLEPIEVPTTAPSTSGMARAPSRWTPATHPMS